MSVTFTARGPGSAGPIGGPNFGQGNAACVLEALELGTGAMWGEIDLDRFERGVTAAIGALIIARAVGKLGRLERAVRAEVAGDRFVSFGLSLGGLRDRLALLEVFCLEARAARCTLVAWS